jgi:hypothetical protein
VIYQRLRSSQWSRSWPDFGQERSDQARRNNAAPTSATITRAVFILASLILFCAQVNAATVTAASASLAHVQTAYDSTANGDTLAIPAGTASWNGTLWVNKGIHIQGAGTASTIISDNLSSNAHLIAITLTNGWTNRVSYIQFATALPARDPYNTLGAIYATGFNTNTNRIRIDHCIFTNLTAPMFTWETALGVVDHCTNYGAGAAWCGFIKGSSWGGNSYGDGSWLAGDQLGTENAIYFEDCDWTYLGVTVHATLIDAQAGGRYVVRNSAIRKGALDCHGVESGQRERSTRAVEVYRNTFVGADLGQQITFMRGGVGVVWSNTVSGYQASATPMKLLVFRAGATFTPFNGATGTNAWDTNYQAGAFYSGTATASNNLTATVSGAGWTINQWVDYSVLRTSDIIGSGNQFHGIITANTSDTITWQTSGVGAELRIAVGDDISFYRVAHALDQPGRCCDSTLLSGATPAVPADWHQLTSPWYEWGNTMEAGADIDFAANHSIIDENVHFYNDTEKPGYTPYTYPHPLIAATEGSGGESPAVTTSPKVHTKGNVHKKGHVHTR